MCATPTYGGIAPIKGQFMVEELKRGDLEYLGVIKHRLNDLAETQGLNVRSARGRPLKKTKGKILRMVHSCIVFESLWLVETLERVLGQKALMPVGVAPEEEEEEVEEEEKP